MTAADRFAKWAGEPHIGTASSRKLNLLLALWERGVMDDMFPVLIVAALAGSVFSAGPDNIPKLRQLTSREIVSAFRGHYVAYAPPNSADTGIHEEFHDGGRWKGTRYSRGPVPFAGQWKVTNNQLCIHAEQGLRGATWEHKWVCRKIWKDVSGKLLMPHLTLSTNFPAPMELSVRQLPK